MLAPAGTRPAWLKQGDGTLWFARVEKDATTIWAQFPAVDPNERLVEINVRRTVFYPDRPGRNYITVRGFALRHAATQWAPPTAEQVGLIGPHWSKGWIIEDNTISHSVCAGVSLGKYGDRWDNTSADTAEGYVKTIERALENGWNKETIGHHVVRNNDISHCEQAGVVGSLGAAFSTVADNTIHDIHVRRLFGGAEMAGIKLHAAIDVQIRHNTIYRTCLGLWLDWMAQGTRVTSNLFHANGLDLFVEVDHGPFLVDNNLFLSPATLLSVSQGGAFAHNLMTGTLRINTYDARRTPFHKPHSTAVAGLHDNPNGDDRYFNNVLVGPADLSQYDQRQAARPHGRQRLPQGREALGPRGEPAGALGLRPRHPPGRDARRDRPGRDRALRGDLGPDAQARHHRAARQGGHPRRLVRGARRQPDRDSTWITSASRGTPPTPRRGRSRG